MFDGECIEGEGCSLLDNSGCNEPARPYCHLIGRTTVCRAEGQGQAGDDCRDLVAGPQPCAPGFVCNGSICRGLCDPTTQMFCSDGERCADVSGTVGQTAGMCVERNCNVYTGLGCSNREVCRFAIATDGRSVGSCRPLPDPQKLLVKPAYGTNDNCAGMVCVRAMSGNFCRQLCDSGGYEITCPANRVCREALQNEAGIIRGVGVCITNL